MTQAQITRPQGAAGLEHVSVTGTSPTDRHKTQATLGDDFKTTPSALPTRSAVESAAALALSLDPEDQPRWAAHQFGRTQSGYVPGRARDAAPGDPGETVRLFPTGPPGIPAVARYA
ncbi:MAG: hypothetical protein ABWY78_08065 [Microvirga sp.]